MKLLKAYKVTMAQSLDPRASTRIVRVKAKSTASAAEEAKRQCPDEYVDTVHYAHGRRGHVL